QTRQRVSRPGESLLLELCSSSTHSSLVCKLEHCTENIDASTESADFLVRSDKRRQNRGSDRPTCGLTAPSVRQMFNVSRLCCMHPQLKVRVNIPLMASRYLCSQ